MKFGITFWLVVYLVLFCWDAFGTAQLVEIDSAQYEDLVTSINNVTHMVALTMGAILALIFSNRLRMF